MGPARIDVLPEIAQSVTSQWSEPKQGFLWKGSLRLQYRFGVQKGRNGIINKEQHQDKTWDEVSIELGRRIWDS